MEATGTLSENLVLVDRDIQLMRYLNEHKYLSTEQIYKTFWPESPERNGAGRQRLDKLEQAGYVKKYSSTAKIPMLFLVAKKGIEALKEKSWDYEFKELSEIDESIVEHNLKLFHVRKKFEAMGVKEWKTERVFRSQETTRLWYPDAVFKWAGYLFAVELENTFRNKKIYEQKFQWYKDEQEFRGVFYVINWPYVKSWLMDFESTHSKIGFVIYDEFYKTGPRALVENKMSKMSMGVMFDA